ncbi:MAG: hypothetical protein KIG68_08685, partial [Oxalobacter sp.]|nr:hypothetical protein [Oxalobacter sp.]
ILFASILTLGLVGCGKKNAKDTSKSSQKIAQIVSAEEFLKDYKQNAINADNKYKGKEIEVFGEVDEIGSSGSRHYIKFKTGEVIDNPTFIISRDAPSSMFSNLKKGDFLNLKCIGSSSFAGMPSATDCVKKAF